MHITEETFRTITLRKWEASQVANEMAALCEGADIDIKDYPALNSLFGALWYIGEEDTAIPVIPEQEVEAEPPTTTEIT